MILAFVVPSAPESPGQVGGSGTGGWQKSDFKERIQGLADELKSRDFSRSGSGGKNLLGLVIVLLGVMMLVNQIFPAHWFGWNFFWPLIFIIFGLYVLTRNRGD